VNTKHRFDAHKALEVILYVARTVPDMYRALKMLYFADKEHLGRYGRLISGDSYVAMSHGPVPSGAYDLVKLARGDGLCYADIPVHKAFAVDGHDIVPCREANLDLLSESDMECLDSAIKRYGHLTFGRLKTLSHDKAFAAADQNDFIPLEAIAASLPDGDLIVDYIKNA
jgi:uncharacterized phage-associated protein